MLLHCTSIPTTTNIEQPMLMYYGFFSQGIDVSMLAVVSGRKGRSAGSNRCVLPSEQVHPAMQNVNIIMVVSLINSCRYYQIVCISSHFNLLKYVFRSSANEMVKSFQGFKLFFYSHHSSLVCVVCQQMCFYSCSTMRTAILPFTIQDC